MNYSLIDENETILKGEFIGSSNNFLSISKFTKPVVEIDQNSYTLTKKNGCYLYNDNYLKIVLRSKNKKRCSLRIEVF
jgi:hypothetical protein